MATFWQILSIDNRNRLAEFYEEKFGKAFIPPGRHDKDIEVKTKLEDIEEIDRLMRQRPAGRPGRG